MFSIPGLDIFLMAMPHSEGWSSMHLYCNDEETYESIVILLDLIPIVRYYVDVFHEILELLSSQEIEFVINLASGNMSIVRVTYHMDPLEML